MKKKLLLFSMAFIALFCSFINFSHTSKPGYSPQVGASDHFMLGAMQNHYDYEHQYISNPNVFGMNLWHLYTTSIYDTVRGRMVVKKGWFHGDSLDALQNDYDDTAKVFIDKMGSYNMRMLMHRPKIEYLCYGQRSDYQCEEVQYVDENLWFYSFQTNNGESVPDISYAGGNYVLRCSTGVDSPGNVLSGLRCNNQQNKADTNWRYDARSTWHIKPSIRIDSAFVANPLNDNTPVCRIDVIDSDGDTIKQVNILSKNFKDLPSNPYQGQYLEEFYFDPGTNLELYGSWGEADAWESRGNGSSPNQADIQVHWYGNCDMWIDYIRVDDDIADKLFDPVDNFDEWIDWEADLANYAKSQDAQYRFYIEELDFNNVPCISYVNKKLQEYTSPDTVDMMVCFYWANFTNHMPGGHAITQGYWKEGEAFDAETLNEVFMEPAGLREFFTETYQFSAPQSGGSYLNKLPNTFDNYIPEPQCVFATSTTPSQYEEWLQDQLDMDGYPNPGVSMPDALNEAFWVDQGFFRWAMNMANDLSKLTGKPFINMPQAHLWKNGEIEKRKEPTNEEMHMATNLALSYGAKGIIFFWYGGGDDCGDEQFGKGFLNSGDRGRLNVSKMPTDRINGTA